MVLETLEISSKVKSVFFQACKSYGKIQYLYAIYIHI